MPFFWFLNLQNKRYFSTQEFTHYMSTSVVSASSHALWCVLSKANLSAWSLLSWLSTHKQHWERKIFHSCLLSTVTVLPNFEGECQIWDYVNRDTSFNLWQFWLESRRRAAYCGGELRNRESWLHGNGKEAGLKCSFSLSRSSEPLAQDRYYARSLVLFAFITGNSSLESLPEGVLAQIHMNLSSRGFGWIEVGTCGQPIFLLGAMLLSIGLKWRMNHTP